MYSIVSATTFWDDYPLFGLGTGIGKWERISLQLNANTVLLNSYDNSLENGWGSSMKNIFSNIGLAHLFLNEQTPNKAPNTQIFLREKHIFEQEAPSNIQKMSKLESYSFVKHKSVFEGYLVSVENVSERIALFKLRLSNHNLMIEKGRHVGMARSVPNL